MSFAPVSSVSHACHAVSCLVSSGFNGFTRLPPSIRDRCPSRLRSKIALQDCPSGLSFRIALQDWPSRMSVAIALQDCHSGLPFQLRFGKSQKGSVSGSEKYHLSKYIFLWVPPSTPKYNAETNKSPMKLFKDGTLFIPPRALQFFCFVLGGSGGPRARPCFISEGWYFSDPDPEAEMCKKKNKTTAFFKRTWNFLPRTNVCGQVVCKQSCEK